MHSNGTANSRDFGLIDAHAHLHLKPGATEELLATMDAHGIERTVVVAGGTVSPETLAEHFSRGGSSDVTVDNAAVLAACLATNGRLLPFFFANPLHGPEAYRAAGRRFHGLKLAPIVHGVPFTDPRIQALVEAAGDFGHPIYLHCLPRAGFEVADLAELAKRNPNVRFILGHGGVGHGDFVGIGQVKPVPNVFFEISGSFTHATRIAVKALGARRVLFGSEWPLQDPLVEITKLSCLNLPKEDLRRIMRDNVAELLAN